MRFIRTSNNYVEFIEADDSGKILSSRGFQFGELYFQIKNGKVTFYLNDQENPWRNDVWTINIPFELDGVIYDNEDDASAVLHNIMNDRFQEQLDQLKEDLAAETARAQEAEEQLDDKIDDERDRAMQVEGELQDEMESLSATVATFDSRITRAENDARQAFEYTEAEIARSTAKDAEHDALISSLTNTLNSEIQRALSAETEIANDLDAEITRSTAKDNEHDVILSALTQSTQGLRNDLDREILDRISGDTRLENLLNSEVARAISAETEIINDLDDEIARTSEEITRSTTKDAEHDLILSGLTDDVATLYETKQNKLIAGKYIQISGDVISAESNHIIRLTQNAYDNLEEIDPEAFYIIVDAPDIDFRDYVTLSAFTAEVQRSTNKDVEHDTAIANLQSAVSSEMSRAMARENALDDKIDAEITRSTAKDASHDTSISNLITSLNNEITRATSAETVLHDEILSERNRINTIDDKVDAEVLRSTSKDTEHDALISGLTEDLSDLDDKVDLEILNRVSGDTNLQTQITNLDNTKANKTEVYTKAEVDEKIEEIDVNPYTAGNNISIVNKVISAVDTTYTAGDGISIVNNVISAMMKFWCGDETEWSQISGHTDANTIYMVHD